MQKKRKWILAVVILLIACMALGFLLEWPVLLINGKPIYQQEFEIHGQVVDRVLRSQVIMEWADQRRSFGQMIRAMETENQKRKEMIEKGEPIYGPAEFNEIQYYKKYISDCEQQIKKQIEQNATQDDLLLFYNDHLQEYQHIDTISADYTLWQQGNLVKQGTVQLDQYTIRGLSETSEELVEKLLQLQPQQQIVWDVEDGLQMQIFCTQREKGEIAPFEEVAGAVLQQYAAWQLETQLEKRMKESTVWTFNKNVGGNP